MPQALHKSHESFEHQHIEPIGKREHMVRSWRKESTGNTEKHRGIIQEIQTWQVKEEENIRINILIKKLSDHL